MRSLLIRGARVITPGNDLGVTDIFIEAGTKHEAGSTCLGVHLEGPFFNPDMAGAQNPAYLIKPDAAMVKCLDAISSTRARKPTRPILLMMPCVGRRHSSMP